MELDKRIQLGDKQMNVSITLVKQEEMKRSIE
jgi:hypothetical protein